MAPQIYLTRHGKTLANQENRFAGRSDEPLCPEGRRQLQKLAAECLTMGLTALYSGPLRRTLQSGQILAEKCRLPLREAPALTDIHLPHWDGLTKAEIRHRFGQEYPTWLAAPEKFRVSGCEDLAAVQKRAVAAVEEIGTREEGIVLLVTHLIVARCLLLHYNNQPLSLFREIKVANGEVVQLL